MTDDRHTLALWGTAFSIAGILAGWLGAVAVALVTPAFRKLVVRALREEAPAVKELIDGWYEPMIEANAHARAHLDAMARDAERAQLDMREVRDEVMRALSTLPGLTNEVTRISAVITASTRAQEKVAEAVERVAEQTARLTGEFTQFQREYDRRANSPRPYYGPERRGGGS